MVIQFGALPLIGISLLGITLSSFLFIYWNSFWRTYARSYFRVTILVTLVSIVQAVLMSVYDGVHARLVYSIALPLVSIEQIAAVEALILTFGLKKPSWFKTFWWLGIAFLGVSFVFHNRIYPVLQPVPDGYFFGSPKSAIGFTILKSTVFCTTLTALICVVLTGLKKQGYRKRWAYALSIFFYAACLFNDSIFLQHFHTWYPTTWIAALLFFCMLWSEVRWHMQEVYTSLDKDILTGAYSRSFGERYLTKVLEKQSACLIYADIDNFKEINDAFGHHVGDQVLKQIVELVQPLMTSPNALIRLGGDEFLFVFPGAASADESHLRTRLQTVFDGTNAFVDIGYEIRPSISLGFGYAEKGSSWQHIVQCADLSMYRQKTVKKLNRYGDGR